MRGVLNCTVFANLNTACSAPPMGDDETQASLEKTAFLPLVANILCHGISWLPSSSCSAAWQEGQTGTIRARAEAGETHPTINYN